MTDCDRILRALDACKTPYLTSEEFGSPRWVQLVRDGNEANSIILTFDDSEELTGVAWTSGFAGGA